MRTRILTLRTVEGKTMLDMALGLNASETISTITIPLKDKAITLNKFEFLNKRKVYDDGERFFILCTKAVTLDWAFDVLMLHAIGKVDQRIEMLKGLKENYQKELKAA